MNDKVEETVFQVIEDYLDVDKKDVRLGQNFKEDLGTDSLDEIELLMGMEDAFGIEIPDEEAEKFATVRDAVDYIRGVV